MNAYAMYLRKSRSDAEMEAFSKEDTLKRHRSILDDLANRLKIKVTDIFTEVVSGENIADRPEIQKLLQNIYQKKYSGVLVVEVERLARGDTKDQGTIAEAFKYTNTKIITPTKIYDPQNEFDEEYFEFGLFMSRREYKTINRRMQRGKLSSVQEGNYIASTRPYGYNIVRRSKKERTLEIIPEEAEVIRIIYTKFIEDKWNASQIARYLTKMGIPTYSGNKEWGHSAVNEILHNHVYAGFTRWSYRPQIKTFDENGNIQKKVSARGSGNMILSKGKHEAIINPELFEAAQGRFKDEPNRVPLSTTLKNPFAGLVFCKKCGKAFFYHDTKKSKGTRVRLAHKVSQICHIKSCFYDDFQNAVISSLRGNILDFTTKLESGNDHNQITEHAQMIAAAEKELKELAARRGNLFDLLERGIYSESDFIERKSLIDEQKNQLEEALLNLKASVPEKIDYAEKIVQFSEAINALENPHMEAEAKNKLLKSIIKRIEFSRDNEDDFILDIYLK